MYRVLIVLTVLYAVAALPSSTKISTLPHQFNGRIVGGEDADIRDYPHQVSIRYNGWHFCGGSIFDTNIIVTASHCVDWLEDASNVSVAAGSTTLSSDHQEIRAIKFIMSENYSSVNNDYDVALLILNGDFKYNEFVQPIPLAKERLEAGTQVTVTGWGTLSSGGDSPDILQTVDVNIVAQSTCSRRYPVLLSQRMVCASVSGGGKDACQGDSGGPLIHNNTLIGIVSWGFGCASSIFPGVYASVPELYDWIVETRETYAKVGSIDFL